MPFLRALEASEREALERLVRSRTEQARLVERARIIQRLSQGVESEAVAREMGLNANTVRLWLRRFNQAGLAGLTNKPRPGKPPSILPSRLRKGETRWLPLRCSTPRPRRPPKKGGAWL